MGELNLSKKLHRRMPNSGVKLPLNYDFKGFFVSSRKVGKIMKFEQDFRDLLVEFERAGVRYLLIGGYAVSLHSRPRHTKDIDIWIDASKENSAHAGAALDKFGAPLRAIQDVVACADDEIVWFGNPPGRVDILKSIPGVTFDDAYRNRDLIVIDDLRISVIARDDLIKAKLASGRPQDLVDVEALRETQ